MRISPIVLLLCVGVLGCGSEAKLAKIEKADADFAEAEKKQITGQETLTNSIGMKLKLIPAGEFQMGSPANEEGRDDDEHHHRVRITKPFYLGVYEVTQRDYAKVMGNNPSYFSSSGGGGERVSGMDTSRFPVEEVSWEDAVEFCRKLSALAGERSASRVYRLPSEAEWEYACRAGTTTAFHFGTQLNGREANCNGDRPYGTSAKGTNLQRPTNVGSYTSNSFGLYDMHGNVYEWCSDWYGNYPSGSVTDPTGPTGASDRVFRGGSWFYFARICRSAFRNRSTPTYRNDYLGFRVALVPPSE